MYIHKYIHIYIYIYIYIYIHIYIYIYMYIYICKLTKVRLPHRRSGDSQGHETFLAPSADKQTRKCQGK